METLCEHYGIKVTTVKECIISKDKIPFKYSLKNWKRKRFCVDLSFILLIYGMKSLPCLSKEVRPTRFVRDLMKGVKVHESELISNNKESKIDIEKLKNEKDKENALKISGEEVALASEIISKNIENVENETNKKGKKKVSRRIVSRLKGLETSLKKTIKPEFIEEEKDLYTKPLLKRAAIMNGNIVDKIEESNINSDKLSYKDILRSCPIKITHSFINNSKIYDSSELLGECQKVFSESIKNKKIIEERTLKSSVINLELRSVDEELKKIAEIKLHKYDDEKREEKRASKSYFTERRRVLRMLVQDNEPFKGIKKPDGGISSFCAKETLCSFAEVIKTVENEDKNYGSRYRVLLDLNTEDIGGVIKGKQVKKESESSIDFEQGEKTVVKYRVKGAISKSTKHKNPKNSKKKKKKIEKMRNNRIKNRNNLLKETSEDKESSEKVINLFKRISHFKRGDRHFENKNPKEKMIKMNERTMVKILEKYIPKEFLEFKPPNEKEDLEYKVYSNPKEWLEEQIQLKINKIRTTKELLH